MRQFREGNVPYEAVRSPSVASRKPRRPLSCAPFQNPSGECSVVTERRQTWAANDGTPLVIRYCKSLQGPGRMRVSKAACYADFFIYPPFLRRAASAVVGNRDRSRSRPDRWPDRRVPVVCHRPSRRSPLAASAGIVSISSKAAASDPPLQPALVQLRRHHRILEAARADQGLCAASGAIVQPAAPPLPATPENRRSLCGRCHGRYRYSSSPRFPRVSHFFR
jgi:hypothetical protein